MSDIHDKTIEIDPRPVDAVARRAALLVTLVRRAAIEVPVEESDETDAFMRETDRFELYSWSRREFESEMSDEERALLQAPAGNLDEEETDQCLAAGVPAHALAWTVGALDSLAPTDTPDAHIDVLNDWVPEPWQEVARWAARLSLRPEETLAQERERWELWHWRATLTPEDLEPGESLGAAVAEVAREASAANLVATRDDDFAVDGRSFASLAPDEQDALAGLAEAYLLALNWVCGFGRSWENTLLYPE